MAKRDLRGSPATLNNNNITPTYNTQSPHYNITCNRSASEDVSIVKKKMEII